MPISVRTATLDDLEVIYKIELECFDNNAFAKQQLEYLVRAKRSVTLIAVLSGEPVGFITGSVGHSKKTIGHIYTLDVKRDHRRKGVASRLLDSLERVLADRGVDTCYLEASVDNVAARNLYIKHGYKPVETLRDYYRPGVDGIRFKKELRKPTNVPAEHLFVSGCP